MNAVRDVFAKEHKKTPGEKKLAGVIKPAGIQKKRQSNGKRRFR